MGRIKQRLKLTISKALLKWERFKNKRVEDVLNWELRQNGSQGRITHFVDIRNAHNVFVGKNSYINGGMIAASKKHQDTNRR